MTQEAFIAAILAVPENRREVVLAAAKGDTKPQPITGRQAAEILGAHRRTVTRYAKAGLLHQISITPRMIRFDRREVEKLATMGAAR